MHFPEDKLEKILDAIKSMNIDNKKTSAIKKAIEKEYHTEPTFEVEPLNKGIKIILFVMRTTKFNKLKKFSDHFLVDMMYVNLEPDTLYKVLEVVNSTYHSHEKKLTMNK